MPSAFLTSSRARTALVAIAISAVCFPGLDESQSAGMFEITCLGGNLRVTAPQAWGLMSEEAVPFDSESGLVLEGMCGQQGRWGATVIREEHHGESVRSREAAFAALKSRFRDVQWLDDTRIIYREKSEPYQSHDSDWSVCSMRTLRARRCVHFRLQTATPNSSCG
jgi:hypothetical protein